MAGSPRKRARREREAAAGEPPIHGGAGAPAPIPEAEPVAPSLGGRRRPTPRAAPNAYHRPASGSGWDLGSGPESRRVIDSQRADVIAGLGAALGSSVTIRIFRTRPSWCAGFLEDSTAEIETVGELLDYLREEYGGLRYKIQALSPRGDPMFEATIPIAGPPREQGRLINREAWEAFARGEQYRPPVSVQAPAAAPASPASGPAVDVTALLGMIISESRANNAAILESMRHQSEAQQRQNTEIIRAMQGPSQGATLAESFRGVAAAAGELGKVGKALRQLAPPAPADGGAASAPDPDALRKAARENFMMNMIGQSMFGGGGQQQPRYPRHPVQRAPAPSANGQEIPDAITD